MKELRFEGLREGQEARGRYLITPEVYEGFLRVFGDLNPLHVDARYAGSKGFPGVVMHGAILNGFISHFVGMVLPGKRTLIHSVKVEFKKPTFMGDELSILGRVEQKVDALHCVVLRLEINNETRGEIAALARVQAGLL